MNKIEISDMREKALSSCTTFDTMRDFTVKACDELLKTTEAFVRCKKFMPINDLISRSALIELGRV